MKRLAHRKLMLAVTASAMTALVASACSSNAKTSGSASAPGAVTNSSVSTGGSSAGNNNASGAASVQTTNGSMGTFLADSSGRTLYLFAADKSTASTCYDSCATFWPPLLTKGAPTGSGQADASKLGTTPRKDGTTQVTYAGHPLYYYKQDAKPGDTNGQGSNGFGALWWVVAPDGTAISATSGGASSSSTSGGGYGGY
jgi:predicted lipoprotein with Yx(FWY)xxD motif